MDITTELLASHHPDAGDRDAYARVFGGAMAGDATLLAREDSVEEGWRMVDPVWQAATPVYAYEAKTWGPSEGDHQVTSSGGWDNALVTG